jgi:hypothetical protein
VRLTLPENPLSAVTVIVDVREAPAFPEVDVALVEKSHGVAPPTATQCTAITFVLEESVATNLTMYWPADE